MLESIDYQNINRFKDEIHKHHFLDNVYKAFRKKVSVTLGEVFGYNHLLFGYLDNKEQRETSMNIATHNLPIDFVQKLLSDYLQPDKPLDVKGDVTMLSSLQNYKKKRLFKELLAPYGFSDYMLVFLKVDSTYIAYIMLFRQKKVFALKDKEIMEGLNDYIAVEYFNYISFLQLKNINDLLVRQTNYYPIGIIVMEDQNSVTFLNEIAKAYLKDLNINDSRFFSVFYNNNILPYVKYDMMSYGKLNTVRFENYLFSIVANNPYPANTVAGNLDKIEQIQFDADAINHLPSIKGATVCVYIFKDELTSHSNFKEFFDSYTLTHREKEIVDLIVLGYSNQQIASHCSISVNTVKVHIRGIYKKVEVNNRAELLLKVNNNSARLL